MKKFISILSITFISLIIGTIFIIDIRQNHYIDIKNDNLMWNLYDINIQEINDNMNPIMEPNDEFKWFSLKDIASEDEEYEKLLNEISKRVTTCYFNFENDGSNYTDNNYAKKFRDSYRISKDDLNNLKYFSKYYCTDVFKYYKDIELDIEKNNEDRFLNKIDEVLNFENKYLIKYPKNYNDFIYNEIIETEILKNISEFLNDEYYRLK